MDRSSLTKLSSCLGEASELVKKILDDENASSETSRPETSSSGGNRLFSALQRARSMLNSSQSSTSGLGKRLNKRERLRATSTANDQGQRKKAKKEDMKAFEFVLLSLGEEDEDEWTISDDKIMLRGLIQLSPESSEADIRRKLGEVTRVKFPTVTDSDFVFLRAIRRKLSIPVTCDSFAYKQLKVVAGQGSIYVKLKPGFECLLENNDSSYDELLTSYMGKNEQVNYSQSIRVSNSQSTSQVDNSQSACQVDNSQSTRVDNSQSTARLGNSQSTQVYNSQSTSQLDNG